MTNPLNIILMILVYDYSNIGSSLVVYIFHKASFHKYFEAMKYIWICKYLILSERPSLMETVDFDELTLLSRAYQLQNEPNHIDEILLRYTCSCIYKFVIRRLFFKNEMRLTYRKKTHTRKLFAHVDFHGIPKRKKVHYFFDFQF